MLVMRFFEKTKGSISVFLILVLMPMYTCAYLAVDTARYMAAESKINGAMDLTGNAALADYDEDLKDLYGIFAMSKDVTELTDNLAPYFSNMIDTAEVPLISDTFVQVLLNKVISGIASAESGGNSAGEFENAVYTETADFSATYIGESTLVDTDVLEAEIRSFMKYRAPLRFASGTMQKLAAFSSIRDLAGVFSLSSAYYSALSSAESSLNDVFDIFPSNDEKSPENVKSSLTDVLAVLPELRQAILRTASDAESLNAAIDELDNGEIKSLLSAEYGNLTEILSVESVDELQLVLESDIQTLNELHDSTQEIGNLTYRDNELYEYLLATYGSNQNNSVSSEEAQSLKSDLNQIAETDLSDFYSTYSEIGDFEVSGVIIHSVWDAIYENGEFQDAGRDVNGNSLGEKFSLIENVLTDFPTTAKNMALNAYETEYFTEMFACLTTAADDKNLLGKNYSNRSAFIGEAEYIIFGNDWLLDNLSSSTNFMFAMRLVMNSLYVFSNANMRQSALVTASVIAGTGGIGVPLAQNLLLLAWSMAESVMDVASLCKGEIVPIYKSAATWTLSLDGITDTLSAGVKNYACRQIDDIFYQIENAVETGYENVSDAVLSYMNRTGESATESLVSMVLTPVEKKVSSLSLENVLSYTREDIEKHLTDAVNSVNNDSNGFKMAKNLFLKYCLPTLTDVLTTNLPAMASENVSISKAALKAVQDAMSDAYTDLFLALKEKVEDFESAQLSAIDKLADKTEKSLQNSAISIVNDYTEKLSIFLGKSPETSGISGSTISSHSGMGMNYKDYLKVFAFLKMCNEDTKKQMLRRAMCVMQINCSGTKTPGSFGVSESPNTTFDISKCYTRIEFKSKVNVGLHRIEKSEVYGY